MGEEVGAEELHAGLYLGEGAAALLLLVVHRNTFPAQ